MFKIVRLFAILALFASPAMATDWYFAATAQGSANGTSCANAYAYSDATNGINTSGKNAAGNNLHVCGTITLAAGATFWQPPNSGTSGNPITLIFENGSGIQAPYFGDNPFSGGPGGIYCANKNYITVNMGTNGVIQNTANGTGLANQHASTLIYATGCGHFTLTGAGTISPTYVHTIGDNSGVGDTASVWLQDGDNVTVQGTSTNSLYIANANFAFNLGSDAAGQITSANISNATFDHACHSFVIGNGSNNATMSGVNIFNNTMGPHNQEWADANANCHQDGAFLVSGTLPGTSISNVNFYNNIVKSDMCSNQSFSANNCTGLVVVGENVSNFNIFNNLVQYTGTVGGFEGLFVLRDEGDSGQSNVHIYNNTIDMNNGAVGSSCKCDVFDYDSTSPSGGTGFQAKNNIILNANGNNVFEMEELTFNTVWGSNINNNDYYGVTSDIGYEATGGVHYNWSTAVVWTTSHVTNSFPGYDGNGTIGNPNITGNYALGSGSAAYLLGTNLTSLGITALNSDAIGVARPSTGCSAPGSTGCWDAGWKQYAVIPNPINPGITIQGNLVPPSNLRVVSIGGVPIAKGIPAAAERPRWALAYPWAVDQLP